MGKRKKKLFYFKNSGIEMNFHFKEQAINLQMAVIHVRENKAAGGGGIPRERFFFL